VLKTASFEPYFAKKYWSYSCGRSRTRRIRVTVLALDTPIGVNLGEWISSGGTR